MSTELTRGQRWIYGQLNGSTAINVPVYEYPAPQGAATPYVLIDFMSATDTLLLGQTRGSIYAYYAVIAVGEDTPTLRLEPLADAIDASLAGQRGQVDNITIQLCQRTKTLLNASLEVGDQRRSLGGLYKLTLTPS